MAEDAQRIVEEMLEQGVGFDRIEDYIEARQDLESDQRSALWLYAWTEVDRPARQKAVAEIFAAMA